MEIFFDIIGGGIGVVLYFLFQGFPAEYRAARRRTGKYAPSR